MFGFGKPYDAVLANGMSRFPIPIHGFRPSTIVETTYVNLPVTLDLDGDEDDSGLNRLQSIPILQSSDATMFSTVR